VLRLTSSAAAATALQTTATTTASLTATAALCCWLAASRHHRNHTTKLHYTILHIYSVHTGSADSVEVPAGHWFNLELDKQSLPVQMQLWTEFEQNCGRPGILDESGIFAVEPQSADLAGDSPCLHLCGVVCNSIYVFIQ
jgi:hypothetical protein